MLRLIQQNQDAVTPSTALTSYTNCNVMSPSPSGPMPMHNELVRTATAVLCKEMLPVQPPAGRSTAGFLGLREMEQVESRLRALARLERVLRENMYGVSVSATQLGAMGDRDAAVVTPGEGRARKLFAEALRDGYVLCQLMNKLRPQSIGRIDPHEDGILRTSNMARFLDSCFTNGFPPEDIFLRDDLVRVTPDSLARVANTVIALINCKWEKMPAPRRFHLLRGIENAKPDENPRTRQPMPFAHPQIGVGNSDPIPIPSKRQQFAHPERKRSNVHSAKNQSNSWSMRNQSIAHSMINHFINHRRTKQSFSPRNTNVNSTHSGPRESGAVRNECSPIDVVGLNLQVSRVEVADPRIEKVTDPRIEKVADPRIEPSGSTSTSDDSKSGKVFYLREEGKASTQFQLGNPIGHGPCACVYRAINSDTRQMVAVKQIQLEGFKEADVVRLMQDVDLVKQYSHPNIIKYDGMVRDKNALSIVLEYAPNGSLKQMLEEFGQLSEKLVASYVVPVLEGLCYLHYNDIVHGNLKAANIVMTKSGDVKLSDFGVSLNLYALENVGKGVSCTPNWTAPEVIKRKRATTKSDIWSLGCTVIESLTGQPPYGDLDNALSVMFRIVEDDRPPIPEGISDPLDAFLKECLHRAPAWRPSAKELSQHEWLNWSLNKSQSSIPLPQMVSGDQRENDAVRHAKGDLDVSDTPTPESARPLWMTWWHRVRQAFVHPPPPAQHQSPPEIIPPATAGAEPGLVDVGEQHTFVDATFSKPVSCRVCVEPVETDAVLCSRCFAVAHSKCAPRAQPGCGR